MEQEENRVSKAGLLDFEESGDQLTPSSQGNSFNETESIHSTSQVRNGNSTSEGTSNYILGLLGEEEDIGARISRFEGWLGKDVLLQGNILLTSKYFLFYANLPPPSRETVRATPLAKKSARLLSTMGKTSYHRYWFVLKMGAFIWYQTPGDVYFPRGLLPLHHMKSVEFDNETPEKFIIRCQDDKSYTFRADSRNAAHEWRKAIRKEMFRARNENDVPIAIVRIPFQNIISTSIIGVLDIGHLLTVQCITSVTQPELSRDGTPVENIPSVGRYAFAFFGTPTIVNSLSQKMAAISNDYEFQAGVVPQWTPSGPAVDFNRSKFGEISENVLDTTPPAEFHIKEGNDFGDDAEVWLYPGGLHGESVGSPNSTSLAVSKINSRTDSFTGSRPNSRNLSPSASKSNFDVKAASTVVSPSQTNGNTGHRSKNLFAVLSQKLHKLKHDSSLTPNPSTLFSKTKKVTSFSISDSSNNNSEDVSENEDDADSTYEEEMEFDSLENSKSCKFFDNKFTSAYQESSKSSDLSVPTTPTSKEASKEGTSNVKGKPPSNSEDMNNWFQDCFGLNQDVNLIAQFRCSLKKPGESNLWNGQLYFSDQFLCFQRQAKNSSNSRMVIPIQDVIHLRDEEQTSTKLEFEVCETAYGVFRFFFSEAKMRQSAETIIQRILKEIHQELNESQASEASKEDMKNSETRFIEYSVRSARLSTYEPSLTTKLRYQIPPLIFDPKSSQFNEAFLQKPMKSLKFAMMMVGSRGDVQPYIALCQGLIEEGHKCSIMTHKEFKPWVEEFGIEFEEIAGDPKDLMEIMISHGSISYGFVKDALYHFKGWLKELMHTSWKAIQKIDPDVLIESPSSMVGIHLAESLDIPYFRAFTMPWTRTTAYPQALISPDQKHSGSYNSLTYMIYDRLVWFALAKYVNKWRKHSLHLPETSLDLMRQDDVPFLYCVSPTVLVPPLDQFDWVHTCGYWELRDNANKKQEVDPNIVKFIRRAREMEKSLVYIGFGSIVVTDPAAMTETVVEATRKAGVHCILARGWSSRGSKHTHGEEKDDTPIKSEHILEIESVPHQWLFPQIDVCVHHGGSGTTGASLRCGKPTIVKPFFGDQFFYGSRVENLGVGVYMKKLTIDDLADAITECTTNKRLIRQAHVLGEQIRHEHGVENAILSIYRELIYARDVTTRRRKHTVEASKTGILPDPKNILPHPDNWLPIGSHSKNEESFQHDELSLESHFRELPSHSKHHWFSLPKFGRREEQRRHSTASGEIDVSL